MIVDINIPDTLANVDTSLPLSTDTKAKLAALILYTCKKVSKIEITMGLNIVYITTDIHLEVDKIYRIEQYRKPAIWFEYRSAL